MESLERELCRALCAEVTLHERPGGHTLITTPSMFPDGDSYSIYLKRLPSGGFRLSDMGSTLMHLSYEHDVDKLREGTRSKVFTQILSEMGLTNDDGELFLEIPSHEIASGIFRLGQALTRVHDLTLLKRVQVESTFYDDLQAKLISIVGADRVIKNFVAPNVPNADEYTADFCIQAARKPVLIWGVPSQTKARLATIVMQHLQKHKFAFRSMVIYSDMEVIPRADVSRLTLAANDQVPSLDEVEGLRSKLEDALAA